MYYVKVDDNGSVSEYTIDQLFIDHPDADIYKSKSPNQPNKFKLRNYGVYELEVLPQPKDPDFKYTPDVPVKNASGNWVKGWIPTQKTEEEKLAERRESFEGIQESTDGEAFEWDLKNIKAEMGRRTNEAINNGEDPPLIEDMFQFHQ